PYRSNVRNAEDLGVCKPPTGDVFDPSRLRKRFQAAARRAELRPVRFHDLRHTFGTRMASAGAPLRAIQEWMGHTDQRTTLIYAAYAPDLSQGAMWAARAFGGMGVEQRHAVEGPTTRIEVAKAGRGP